MADQHVTVVTSDNHNLYITAPARQSCQQCSLKQGCGHPLRLSLTGQKDAVLALPVDAIHGRETLLPTENRQLILQLPDAIMIRLSLLLYGIPLGFVLLVSLLVTTLVGPASELRTIFAAILALTTGLLVTGRLAGRQEKQVLAQMGLSQPPD